MFAENNIKNIKVITPDRTGRVADILKECGFVDNLLAEIDLNKEIRELEQKARLNKPLSSSKNESLTNFLSPKEAKRLNDLRKAKNLLKTEENKITSCIRKRLDEERIGLIKTKKGVFGYQK